MNDEIGFNQMIKELFNQQQIDDNNSSFIEKNLEKISEHLNNDKLSIEALISVSSISSYMKVNKEFSDNLKSYIVLNSKEIINNLETLNTNNNFNKKIYQALNEFKDFKVSFKMISSLNNCYRFGWHSYKLFKINKYYGLTNLLLYLCNYSHEEFQDWFLRTKKEDLKIIYINGQLEYQEIYKLNKKFINSKIAFLRAIVKCIIIEKDEKVQDLLPENEENLYFILFYFSRNTYIEVEKLEERITKYEKYFKYLTSEIINEYISIPSKMLVKIINKIEEKNKQKEFYLLILNNIKKLIFIEENEYNINSKIEELNIYGQVLAFIRNKSEVNEIYKRFNEQYLIINEPYYFYRFNTKWCNKLLLLTKLLIIIYIYNKSINNNQKIIEYKKKFIDIKKDFYFVQEDKVNNIINQLN